MTTEVKIKYSTVGGDEDPYARITYEAQVNHQHVVLICCSLCGNSLEVNGVVQSSRWSGDHDADKPVEEFERIVGLTVDQICSAYDDEYNSDAACEAREAERAAGWDASP